MKDLELENLEYEMAEEFSVELKKNFKGRDKKVVKVAELKRLEQEEKIIEEFIQEFWKTARRSGYKRRLLIEKFKHSMNSAI